LRGPPDFGTGFLTDVALVVGDSTPTVDHLRNGKFEYRCDRVYTTLPEEAIIGHEVIQEVNPESGHKPVRIKFRIQRSYLLIA
jgi:hypothetical protein